MNPGKLVTMGIVGLAVALAAFAWSYHRGNSDLAVDYWGPENAVAIRRAPTVVVRTLAPKSAADESAEGTEPEYVQIGDKAWVVTAEQDITAAKGLVHLRQALVLNSSLDWEQAPDESTRWEYLLCFAGAGQAELKIALALEAGALRCLDGRPVIGLRIAGGVREFLDDLQLGG